MARTDWDDYLDNGPVASTEFMEGVEELPVSGIQTRSLQNLVAPQGNDRIDAHRAAGGEVAREQRGHGE